MTANKRFTIENDIEMKDNWNINKRCYHFENGFDAKDCCNMLNELNEEKQHIESVIKEAYQTERTAIGKNTLKQLIEAIQ